MSVPRDVVPTTIPPPPDVGDLTNDVTRSRRTGDGRVVVSGEGSLISPGRPSLFVVQCHGKGKYIQRSVGVERSVSEKGHQYGPDLLRGSRAYFHS